MPATARDEAERLIAKDEGSARLITQLAASDRSWIVGEGSGDEPA